MGDAPGKKIDFDAKQFAVVSQRLKALAQTVYALRAQARAADQPMRVGAGQANPFADTRAGGAVNVLSGNVSSVHKNVQDSLADLQECLRQTAAAIDRVASSVNDHAQDNQKRLRQVLDAAFNPQAARGAGQPSPALPPLGNATRGGN
jgi:ABC-type transporter Mla subunit MlaD